MHYRLLLIASPLLFIFVARKINSLICLMIRYFLELRSTEIQLCQSFSKTITSFAATSFAQSSAV